uniref:Stabilizer of axonemal microtubules 1 n=1 Tax=Otus sunia TaxID=257818 RepID=A0A8C8BNG1_9STRI
LKGVMSSDYTAHEVLPRKLKPSEKHVKSDESMDLTSTYKQDYNLPCLSSTSIPPPCDKTDPQGQDDYVLWHEPKIEPLRPNDRFHPSEEKFDHRTIVQDDYVYRGPKTKAPFENITNYRVSYVPHPLEKRYAHKNEKYKASEVPFDGLTTHKVSYKGLAGQPAKLTKPYQPKLLHDLPFSSTTEFQENYQAQPQPPIFTKKLDAYIPPLEKMDLHTTTQIHYKYPNGKPAKVCRSLAQLKKSTEPFNSSSITKEDYKPWLSKPMDCLTTFHTHYVLHPLTVTKSYKPGWSGPKHHTLLDAKTIYNTSYTPKGIVRCLASYKNPPGYIFEGADADGHNLYVPASKGECLQGGH